MDQQSSSSFFLLPLELRQEIYSYLLPYGAHVFKHGANVVYSACIQPPTHNHLLGYERAPHYTLKMNNSERSVCMQRLKSAWGPHWKCEEAALGHCSISGELSDGRITWLAICKRSKTEMLQYLMSASTLRVTGLEDLQFVLQEAQQTHPSNLDMSLASRAVLSEVQRLEVIIRLPVCTFQEIERLSREASLDNSQYTEEARFWMRPHCAIAELPKLRTLHFWIDHSQTRTWTAVNERAFLSPLDTLAAVRPEVIITVNLPLLHPKWESWDRHFTPGCSPPAYVIQRRVRQRWHTASRHKELRTVSDFPIWFEGDTSEDEDLEAIQKWERRDWESGVDVEEQRQLTEIRVCFDFRGYNRYAQITSDTDMDTHSDTDTDTYTYTDDSDGSIKSE